MASGRADKPQPMQVKEALQAVQELIQPTGGHRKPLRFLPWLQSGGFKVPPPRNKRGEGTHR